jgi:drug/metabolite transporter (DMT)-like permease
VSVVGLTQIVFALALEALVLGEAPGPEKLAGMALVVAPTAWLMVQRPPPPAHPAPEAEVAEPDYPAGGEPL